MPKKKKRRQPKKKRGGEDRNDVVYKLIKKLLDTFETPQAISTPSASRKQIKSVFNILGQIDNAQKQEKRKKESTEKKKTSFDTIASKNRALFDWFLRHGGRSGGKKLELRSSGEEGNGIFALKPIEKNSILFDVPYRLIMHEKKAMKSLSPLVEQCPLLGKLPSLLVSVYLAHEKLKGEESFFAPYIATFPSHFTIPLCYENTEEFELLQGTVAHAKAASLFLSTARHYCHLWQVLASMPADAPGRLFKLSDFTWALFRWSIAVVMTRQNKIPVRTDTTKDAVSVGSGGGGAAATAAAEDDGGKKEEEGVTREKNANDGEVGDTTSTIKTSAPSSGANVEHSIALVPIFDALNHESGGRILTDCKPLEKLENDDDTEERERADDQDTCGFLRAYAMRSFALNEQVRMFYGDRSDTEFVIYSGFLPSRIEGPTIAIDIRLNSNDPLAKLKNLLIFGGPQNQGLVVTIPIQFDRPSKGGQPRTTGGFLQLLQVLRVVVASKDETASLLRFRHASKESNAALATTPISHSNEIRVMEMLGDICARRLKMYPKESSEVESLRKQIDVALTMSEKDVMCDEAKRARLGRRRVALEFLQREQGLLRKLHAHAGTQSKALKDGGGGGEGGGGSA